MGRLGAQEEDTVDPQVGFENCRCGYETALVEADLQWSAMVAFLLRKLFQERGDVSLVDVLLNEWLVFEGRHSLSQLVFERCHF